MRACTVLDTGIWITAISGKGLNDELNRAKALHLIESEDIIIPPQVAFELLQPVNAPPEEMAYIEAKIDQHMAPVFDTLCAKIAAELRRKIYQINGGPITERGKVPNFTMDINILSYCYRWPMIKRFIHNDRIYNIAHDAIKDVSIINKNQLELDVYKVDDPLLFPDGFQTKLQLE